MYIMSERKIVDESFRLSRKRGTLRREVWIDETGKVTDINTRPKSLIRETRKVRTNIPLTGAALRQ